MEKDINNEQNMALFESDPVRRTWHKDQWYFSVVDVVQVLTNSSNAKQYIKKMKLRDNELSVKWGTICTPLEVISKDGRKRAENMSSLQGIFRIIQSVPSSKAEPFKLWLAKVGQERIEEIQDPELAIVRAKRIYEQKGYSDDWIAKRMRGINVRNTLTDEWKNRGAKAGINFAMLTNEIYRGTFEMNAKEIKEFKFLDKPNNLRDRMGEMEFILTMLGEASTTEITKARDSEGLPKLTQDAKEGGAIAGDTREAIENKIGKKIMTNNNFLKGGDKQRRIKNFEELKNE